MRIGTYAGAVLVLVVPMLAAGATEDDCIYQPQVQGDPEAPETPVPIRTLVEMLSDSGVDKPDDIRDYFHLLPEGVSASYDGQTGIATLTVEDSEGGLHTLTVDTLALLTDDLIEFSATVGAWSAAGEITALSDVEIAFTFDVADVPYAQPVRMVLTIPAQVEPAADLPPYTMADYVWSQRVCKCCGGDGSCSVRMCDEDKTCNGGVGDCMWVSKPDPVPTGPSSLWLAGAPVLLLLGFCLCKIAKYSARSLIV